MKRQTIRKELEDRAKAERKHNKTLKANRIAYLEAELNKLKK